VIINLIIESANEAEADSYIAELKGGLASGITVNNAALLSFAVFALDIKRQS